MPGLAMQALARASVRSFLLTSGTLSPLDSFAAELQLDFPITIENPHVVDHSQVWIGVVGVGPRGAKLNSSFKNRSSQAYQEDLGIALVNFARIIPGGLLVFFPSYVALQSCIDRWKAGPSPSPTWDRICAHKQPVIEPRESALFGQAAEDFNKKLDDPLTTGAIFFAVCRGKVSEGLDFSDRAGRAVVITGIPFANVKDAKVQLKKEVLDDAVKRADIASKRTRIGAAAAPVLKGDQWYTQQALRAVNQGMGRVIRHRHDYGAVILCDDRFAEPQNRRQLSAWLRPLVHVHPNFGSANASLAQFFKERRAAEASAVLVAKDTKAEPMLNFLTARKQTREEPGAQSLGLSQVPSALDASGLAHLLHSCRPAAAAAAVPGKGGLLAALQAGTAASDVAPRADAKMPSAMAPTKSMATFLEAALDGSQQANRQAGWEKLERQASAKLQRPQDRGRLDVNAKAGDGRGVRGQPSRFASAALADEKQAGPLARSDAPAAASCLHPGGGPNGVRGKAGDTSTSRIERAAGVEASNTMGGQSGTNNLAQRKPGSKAYLERLKAELPPSVFQKITGGLKAYKTGGLESRQLYDVVLQELCVPGRRHLLVGFQPFVQKADKAWFVNCLKVLTEGSKKASQGASSTPAEQPRADPPHSS